MNYRHYLNITRVSRPIAERVPSEDEIFGDYFAQARCGVSMRTLRTVRDADRRAGRAAGRSATYVDRDRRTASR